MSGGYGALGQGFKEGMDAFANALMSGVALQRQEEKNAQEEQWRKFYGKLAEEQNARAKEAHTQELQARGLEVETRTMDRDEKLRQLEAYA
jgi:hypothetical protein